MSEKHNTYNNDLVSIIIPAYNSERYIVKCLKSLQAQSYKNIEIIIINDGSTDQTQNIIDDFIKTDRRFLLINQGNTGVSGARNVGMKLSKGKYLVFNSRRKKELSDNGQWVRYRTALRSIFHKRSESLSSKLAIKTMISLLDIVSRSALS